MGRVLSDTAAAAALCAAIGVAAALTGCNTTGCTDNKASIPLAGFYSYETQSAISVSEISIGGVDAPNDSLVVNNATASEAYLPFRADADATQYYIHYHSAGIDDPAYNDTLTFSYNRLPYFASEECGAMFRYEITEFTSTYHLIDSVALTDTLVTNFDHEVIQIFFRTYTPPADDETGGEEGGEGEGEGEGGEGDNPDNPDTPDA